jgi:hypothetical protein
VSDILRIKRLPSVKKKRALSGVTLPSNTIVGLDELAPAKAAYELGELITHVDHRVDDSPPDWDDLGESDDKSDDGSE